MLTFLHDIAKPLAENSKNASAACSCLTDKDHPEGTSCKPLIYHNKPVICNFCSHSAKPAWRLQKNDMASFAEALFQSTDEVGTESFVSAHFLIHPEQNANTCMAVLIRRVTCEGLFSF